MTPLIKNYDTENQVMTIALNTGGDINLNMQEEYFGYYGPGCDLELDFIDDATKDIYFNVDGALVTVLQIIQWAQNNHDIIHDEIEQDEADQLKMNEELSSTYLTGRI